MPESPAEPPYRFRKSTRRPRATLPGLSVSRSPANLPPPRPGPVPAHRADTGSAQHIPSKRPQHREPSEAEKCDFQPTSRTWFRVGIPMLEMDGILWRFRAFPLRDATLFTFHASSYIRRTVPVFRLRFQAAARVTSACRGSGRVWGWRRRRYRRARSAAAPFPGKPFAHKSRHRDGEVGAGVRIVRDQADSKPVPHPGRLRGGIVEDADCGKGGPYGLRTADATKHILYHAFDGPLEPGVDHGFHEDPIFFPNLRIGA